MSGNEGKALLDEELLGKFVIGREFELEQKNQGEKAPVKIQSFDFHFSENLLVLVTADAQIRLYDTRKGEQIKTLSSTKYGAALVRFTHHSNCIIYASSRFDSSATDEENHAIRYHSLYDNAYIRYFKGHNAEVLNLSMSRSSDTFLSASRDKTVRMWDLRSEACLAKSNCDSLCTRPCVEIDYSDFMYAVGEDGGDVALIPLDQDNPEKSQPFHKIEGSHSATKACISLMKFSHNGDMLAVLIENKVYVYDISTSRVSKLKENGEVSRGTTVDKTPMALFEIGSPKFKVRLEFSFTPDDKFLISGCEDKHIRIWRLEDQKEIAKLSDPNDPNTDLPACLRWSRRHALFASGSRKLALWIPKK